MTTDLEDLLAPVSDEAPCGPDLSYDDARTKIEEIFHVDIAVGPDGLPRKRPKVNWTAATNEIIDLTARTKDLWVAIALCRAGAEAGKLETVILGAELVAGLAERYWEQVHPVAVADRPSCLVPLSRRPDFLGPLGRTPVFVHPKLGSFDGQTLVRLKREGANLSEFFGPFMDARDEIGDEQLRASSRQVETLGAALEKVAAAFAAKSLSANLTPALDLLSEIDGALKEFFVEKKEGAAEVAEQPVAGAAAPRAVPAFQGSALNSRDDVLKALDLIVAYYRKSEPASPLLPFMERAKIWVPMTFMDLLADISPDSLREAKLVLQRRPPPE